jgi:2-keto-3-deoxy-L-rhamnonate aldolase RhmA
MIRACWQQIINPQVTAALLSNSDNTDAIVLDCEHGIYSKESLFACITAAISEDLGVWLRITQQQVDLIQFAHDNACDGVIFSSVETEAEAQRCIELCTPRNLGGKLGFALSLCNGFQPVARTPLQVAGMIETIEGCRNIKCIYHYFNYVFIGKYDLSASMGIPGEFLNDNFCIEESKLINVIGKEKLGCHIVRGYKKSNEEFCGFLAVGMDTTILSDFMEVNV